jgi:Tol biopolymer transport system component
MSEVAPPFAFLPDGSGIFFYGSTGDRQSTAFSADIYFARIQNGEVQPGYPIYHLDQAANVKTMRVSPDGRYLAYVDLHSLTVRVLDLMDLSSETTFPVQALAEPLFVWSPDGTQVAVAYSGSLEALTLIEVATGESEALLSAPWSWFVPVDWRYVEAH